MRFAENTLRMQFSYSWLVYAGHHIKHADAGRISPDVLGQYINDAAFGNLIAHLR